MVGPSIRWKSDFEKYVVISNFQRRGWKRAEAGEDEGWHIYWANVNTVKNIFLPESGTRLEPYQLLNHFPNHYELTRKDLMVKNLKRYTKQMKKAGIAVPDMLPVTYMLPQDYRLFAEEFKRSGGGQQTTWIVKPTSRAQGKGIFLLKKLSQVKRWETPLLPNATRPAAENHVVSRYIDNPLLIGGKKFDMRIYVVVTSFKPLKVYMSRLGFARFCNMKYSAEAGELDNQFVHLTNVSIQKQQGKQYNSQHGNKWSLSNLRLYIESMYSATAAGQLLHEALWAWPKPLWRRPASRMVQLLTAHKDIEAIVLHSLKACQSAIIQDRHCFELYGYDIIIDDTLKPWLIEVNASPSLACTTPWDRQMKARLIHDTLNVVCSPEWAKSISRRPASAGFRTADSLQDRQAVPGQGSLYLLYDETQQMQQERARREFASVADRGGAKARSAFV